METIVFSMGRILKKCIEEDILYLEGHKFFFRAAVILPEIWYILLLFKASF